MVSLVSASRRSDLSRLLQQRAGIAWHPKREIATASFPSLRTPRHGKVADFTPNISAVVEEESDDQLAFEKTASKLLRGELYCEGSLTKE